MSTARVPESVLRAGGRLIMAILIALGATWGGDGLRETSAQVSQGCEALNAESPDQLAGVFFDSLWFEAGDIVSVTASDPSTNSPTSVRISVGRSRVVVAEVPYPGTASYTIPSTGILDLIGLGVDRGDATLALSCTGIPAATATPTDTATAIPTETATALPTATSTPQPTSTATATETALPINTATATAIPTIVAPTMVPIATSTTVPGPTDEAEAVSELPNTGAGPDGGSGAPARWLLLIGLGGLSLFGLHHRRVRRAR